MSKNYLSVGSMRSEYPRVGVHRSFSYTSTVFVIGTSGFPTHTYTYVVPAYKLVEKSGKRTYLQPENTFKSDAIP